MNPEFVIRWTENIEAALSAVDPANGDEYSRRGGEYRDSLHRVSEEIREGVDRIPAESRKFVSDHVVLGHFADEYGLEVAGTVIPSTSDQSEPSAREISSLVEEIRSEGISLIVLGETAGRGLVDLTRSVAQEAGTQVNVVRVLSGSLAAPGEEGDTYLEFIELNARRIIEGLSTVE